MAIGLLLGALARSQARAKAGKIADPASQTAVESFEASEKGRQRQIAAREKLVTLGAEGVEAAEKAAEESQREIRAQAARALASQFGAVGRRAAGGGTLASLGQSSRDAARAISTQAAQDDLRIQAAKEAAAVTEAEQAQAIADLQDVQGAAEDRFAALMTAAPSTTAGFGDIEAIEYWQDVMTREADPNVRKLIQKQIDLHRGDIGMIEAGVAGIKDLF